MLPWATWTIGLVKQAGDLGLYKPYNCASEKKNGILLLVQITQFAWLIFFLIIYSTVLYFAFSIPVLLFKRRSYARHWSCPPPPEPNPIPGIQPSPHWLQRCLTYIAPLHTHSTQISSSVSAPSYGPITCPLFNKQKSEFCIWSISCDLPGITCSAKFKSRCWWKLVWHDPKPAFWQHNPTYGIAKTWHILAHN